MCDQIIKPYIPSKYMLSSTWEFLDKLKLFIFKPSDCMISFDVVSLFTNVPLIETVDIISDYVYKSKSKPAFSKLVFKELLNIATSGIFMYNGRLYRQVDGFTMGSPLGPTISNFCLAHLENEILSVSKFKPELYLRYVDDIFCLFRDQSTYEKFFQQLNELYSSLKFTFEIGPKILPFLDAKTKLPLDIGRDFKSCVFRKTSHTGLMLNFSAICPYRWKIGLINGMLYRAYNICCNWYSFTKEIEVLRDLFRQNGYPGLTFENCVKRFIDSKFIHCKKQTIPYFGHPSIAFARKLRQSFKRHYNVNLQCSFNTTKI